MSSSRPRWRKQEADTKNRKPGALFDSTPLFIPAKKSVEHGIKSIEISINKTGEQSRQRGRGDITPSSEEDMIDEKEGKDLK